eukprot:1125003_1
MAWCAKIGVMELVDVLLQIKGIVVTSDAVVKAVTVDLYSTGELPIAHKLYKHLISTGGEHIFNKEQFFDVFRGLCHARVDEQKSIPIMKFIARTLMSGDHEVSDLLSMKGDANNIYSANVLLTAMRHKQAGVCQYVMSLIAKDAVVDEINYQDEYGNSVL